jgi:hypothetical protein
LVVGLGPAREYTTTRHDLGDSMSEKTAAEVAAETKPSPDQEHNRIVGCLLAGVDPDQVEEQE